MRSRLETARCREESGSSGPSGSGPSALLSLFFDGLFNQITRSYARLRQTTGVAQSRQGQLTLLWWSRCFLPGLSGSWRGACDDDDDDGLRGDTLNFASMLLCGAGARRQQGQPQCSCTTVSFSSPERASIERSCFVGREHALWTLLPALPFLAERIHGRPTSRVSARCEETSPCGSIGGGKMSR